MLRRLALLFYWAVCTAAALWLAGGVLGLLIDFEGMRTRAAGSFALSLVFAAFVLGPPAAVWMLRWAFLFILSGRRAARVRSGLAFPPGEIG